MYNEDQPRDEHGRWTSGGGGGALGQIVQKPGPKHSESAMVVGGAVWTAEQYAEANHAVEQALEAHPFELGAGVRPLDRVAFLSADSFLNPTARSMVANGALGTTDVTAGRDVRILLNDTVDPLPDIAAAKDQGYSGVTKLGDIVTHEIGHAYFAALGSSTQAENMDTLAANGFGPRTVMDATGSTYGASLPSEGLAELYLAHEHGSLSPEFEAKYQTMVDEAHTNMAPRPSMSGYDEKPYHHAIVLKADSPLMPSVRAAISANLQANRWTGINPFSGLQARIFSNTREAAPRKVHPSAYKMPGGNA